jgi:hypothetical protein
MEFETEGAEKAYKSIINSSGIGYYDVLSSPQEYRAVLEENESVSTQEFEGGYQAIRALRTLESADLLEQKEEGQGYHVVSETELREEVFNKIEEKRQNLL